MRDAQRVDDVRSREQQQTAEHREPVLLRPTPPQRCHADDGADQEQVEDRVGQRNADLQRAPGGLRKHRRERECQHRRRGQTTEQAVQPHCASQRPVFTVHGEHDRGQGERVEAQVADVRDGREGQDRLPGGGHDEHRVPDGEGAHSDGEADQLPATRPCPGHSRPADAGGHQLCELAQPPVHDGLEAVPVGGEPEDVSGQQQPHQRRQGPPPDRRAAAAVCAQGHSTGPHCGLAPRHCPRRFIFSLSAALRPP